MNLWESYFLLEHLVDYLVTNDGPQIFAGIGYYSIFELMGVILLIRAPSRLLSNNYGPQIFAGIGYYSIFELMGVILLIRAPSRLLSN